MGNGCCCPSMNDGGDINLPSEPPNLYVNQDAEIIRLFLIGCGEVGKSTLVKQMLNLCIGRDSFRNYAYFDHTWEHYQIPFHDDDRDDYKPKIFQNVFRIIGTLIRSARQFELHFDSAENEEAAAAIESYVVSVDDLFNRTDIEFGPEWADRIHRLWSADSAINGAWNRRREFLISDSADYFLTRAKLDELAAPGYRPSADDILKCRDPTATSNDYNFLVHKVRFSIKDTGGQPVELGRLPVYLTDWLNRGRPQDRNYILYVAALSDYNQMRRDIGPESGSTEGTQLDVSINLLKTLINYHLLSDTGFILFLNKLDIFHEKLQEYNDFPEYFGDYMRTGMGKAWKSKRHSPSGVFADRKLTTDQAKHLVCLKIMDAIKTTRRPDLHVTVQFTKAVDSHLMDGIFYAIRQLLREDRLDGAGARAFP